MPSYRQSRPLAAPAFVPDSLHLQIHTAVPTWKERKTFWSTYSITYSCCHDAGRSVMGKKLDKETSYLGFLVPAIMQSFRNHKRARTAISRQTEDPDPTGNCAVDRRRMAGFRPRVMPVSQFPLVSATFEGNGITQAGTLVTAGNTDPENHPESVERSAFPDR